MTFSGDCSKIINFKDKTKINSYSTDQVLLKNVFFYSSNSYGWTDN